MLASWIILSQLAFLYFSFGSIPKEKGKGLQFCNCLELYILCIYNKCKLFHMSLFWIMKHHDVWFPFSWDVMLLHWVMGSQCFKTSGSDYPVTWHNLSVTLLWKPCSHKPLDIQLVLVAQRLLKVWDSLDCFSYNSTHGTHFLFHPAFCRAAPL